MVKLCYVGLHILFINIKTVDSTTKGSQIEKFSNETSCFVPIFKRQDVDILEIYNKYVREVCRIHPFVEVVGKQTLLY